MPLPPVTAEFKREPYWWEAARPRDAQHTPLPARADVVVVGSGYAGLCAARTLAGGGASVVVLEQDQLGFGASTRNGGMVSGGVNVGKNKNLAAILGESRLQRLLNDAARAYEYLESLIEREGIDCSYEQCGRFIGAHTPRAYAAQAKKIDYLNDWCGAGARMVPREGQQEFVRTGYYYGGMALDRSGALHPALYHHGLLDACDRRGVLLRSQTPVQSIRRDPRGFVVHAAGVRIEAGEVIVATNGYTGTATPWHRRRVIPVASYIICTEELGRERVESLFPGLGCITDTNRSLAYYRPSPDRERIVFGGRAGHPRSNLDAAVSRLYARMCEIFPSLAGVRISHAWTGNVAFTFDWLPHMGRDDRGIHFCLGCNGSGVAMMSYLGHRTAEKILTPGAPACAYDGLEFPTRPLYRGDPWLITLAGRALEQLDNFERWLAARRS